jgi:hypothetical protein
MNMLIKIMTPQLVNQVEQLSTLFDQLLKVYFNL